MVKSTQLLARQGLQLYKASCISSCCGGWQPSCCAEGVHTQSARVQGWRREEGLAGCVPNPKQVQQLFKSTRYHPLSPCCRKSHDLGGFPALGFSRMGNGINTVHQWDYLFSHVLSLSFLVCVPRAHSRTNSAAQIAQNHPSSAAFV